MTVAHILASLDTEIATLEKVRALLSGGKTTKAAKSAKPVARKKKRKLSAAARKSIGDAQRKRWAAQRAKEKKA